MLQDGLLILDAKQTRLSYACTLITLDHPPGLSAASEKSLRLLRLSWNKWVKMRPSELFQIHESVFLQRVDTEGGDARSSSLQPPWSEKRNGLWSLMRWTWAILIDFDWSIALVSSNTFRHDVMFEELLLVWYVCFLLNLVVVHARMFQRWWWNLKKRNIVLDTLIFHVLDESLLKIFFGQFLVSDST